MFSLKNILAAPLEGKEIESDIWEAEQELSLGYSYLLRAPSGRGKSTFIHLLYGIRHDYSGKLDINNKDAKSLTAEEWAGLRQERLSIVFQDLRLFHSLSARENINANAALQGKTSMLEIESMAKKLGVFDLLDKPAGLLSYGQQQRIAIIRALSQDFNFLLLDEPFSHLDKKNIEAAAQLIVETCKAKSANYLLVSLGEDYNMPFDKVLVL